MKKFILVYIIFLGFISNSQSQQLVKFIFVDLCSNTQKTNVDFYVLPKNITDDYNYSLNKQNDQKKKIKKNYRYLLPGEYIVKCVIKNKNYKTNFEETITITSATKKVTIHIPKLKIRTSMINEEQNDFDKYQNYYFCNKLCNGKYVDYYNNNKKRTEGEFVNGKPLKLIIYNKTDSGKTVSEFNKNQQILKTEKYDEQGKLSELITYTYKKKYIIVKKYNSNNKLTETTKYSRY